MTRYRLPLIIICFLLRPDTSAAHLCSEWDKPTSVGVIDRKAIPEASGLTYSRRWPGEVFWINDSGNKPELILSSADGKNIRKVLIEGPKLRDSETLTSTTCADGEACLIIGDTGDNNSKRKNYELVVVREKDIEDGKVKPLHRLKFQYADGPHDVEAMTALPNGDLLFFTKEFTLSKALPSSVYRLSKTAWQSASSTSTDNASAIGEASLIAERVGQLPIPDWLPGKVFLSTAITDAAVNTKRQVLALLTYSGLIEIQLNKLEDLANAQKWKEDRDYAHVPIHNLGQQESVTYLTTEDQLIWSSEWYSPATPIYSMTCKRAEK